MSIVREYKVVLMGDAGVGKTAFIRQLREGTFSPQYIATLGVVVHPVRFYLADKSGYVQFNVWDCAGQERFSGAYDQYLHGADAVILMASNSALSYKTISQYEDLAREVAGNDIPICYVRNKCELEMSTRFMKDDPKFIRISSKNAINLAAPFEAIARQPFCESPPVNV